MSSVLFHYSVFNRGGAEKSTLRLMKMFVDKGWKVRLVLNFSGGSLESELPPEVEVDHLSVRPMRCYAGLISRVVLRALDAIRYPFLCRKYKNEHYDLALIGLQGLSPRFVCKAVSADVRGIFIRTDIGSPSCSKQGEIVSNIRRYASQIDKIICVSGTVKGSVARLIPECADKAEVVYNLLDLRGMQAAAESAEDPFAPSDYKKVVTVCRMSDRSKALFRMLEVYDKLYAGGIVFEWYFVGDGADLPAMREKVKGKPYEGLIHFEGEKSDPFPYYRYADLVAVLSYYEGLSGAVNEAKISGAAVIATEFSGIREQLTHGKNGWIVANNTDSILGGMETLLTNDELLEGLQNTDYPEAILNDEMKFSAIISVRPQ